MRSRNHSAFDEIAFDEIAETALEEVSAIFSKNEKYKSSNANSEGPKCSNCNKLGHVASRCYLKDRKDTRVNKLSVRKGHMAKHCRKPKKRLERQGLMKERNGYNNQSGNEFRPSESSSRPTVQSTQSAALDRKIMNF